MPKYYSAFTEFIVYYGESLIMHTVYNTVLYSSWKYDIQEKMRKKKVLMGSWYVASADEVCFLKHYSMKENSRVVICLYCIQAYSSLDIVNKKPVSMREGGNSGRLIHITTVRSIVIVFENY